MARIKIQIEGHLLHRVQIPVRITDINYGNHLGNDALVSLLHEARVQWLHSLGLSELNVGGASLIQGDLAVEYTGESFYGDTLQISVYASSLTRVSFDLYYEVWAIRPGQESPLPVARAKTGILCFHYDTRKVAAVPDSFRTLLSA